MTKIDVMELHATQLGGLLPINIVQAAREDLKRRERNLSPYVIDYEHYAFLRRHVAKASDLNTNNDMLKVKSMIELALAYAKQRRLEANTSPPEVPVSIDAAPEVEVPDQISGKKWTRLIYRDIATLEAALEIAAKSAVRKTINQG